MFRKTHPILLALLFSALVVGFTVTPISALNPDQTITITTGPVADKNPLPLYIANGHPETITFLNHTGNQINVNNTSGPSTDKDGPLGNTVIDNSFVNYVFTTPADLGTWVFTITEPGKGTLDVTIVVRAQGPVLTSWGIMILMLLIAGIGIWFLSRRHLAHRGASA